MTRCRLGFLGVGWIGRHRMAAMLDTGLVEAAVVADPAAEMLEAARALAPAAAVAHGLGELLEHEIEGVVIASPSALHAEQAIAALERGVAVFCQKPLGRTGAETAAVIEAARRADRLLAVDLSYRHTEAVLRIREAMAGGALGRVFAADLAFHNAYGPDKPWFYDPALSGGGCVIDLGVHLVDLALWLLDFPAVTAVQSRLFAAGRRTAGDAGICEDFAVATLDLATGAVVRLGCSWRLHAGREAVIAAVFHGEAGGAALENVGGSFHDFRAELFQGTRRRTLAAPPDAWGGRAAVEFARGLAQGGRFDPAAAGLVTVAEVIDRIYGRGAP